MSSTLPNRIMNLYGSAYLAPFNIDATRSRSLNSDLDFIPASRKPAPKKHLPWAAVAMVAIVGLSVSAGYLVSSQSSAGPDALSTQQALDDMIGPPNLATNHTGMELEDDL